MPIQIFKVIAAAKAANIHNFVTALPAGYETNVNTFVIIMRKILEDDYANMW